MFKFANFLFFLLITSLYGANTLSSGLTLTTNDLNSFILGTTFPPDKNPQDLDNGKTPSALNGLISCQLENNTCVVSWASSNAPNPASFLILDLRKNQVIKRPSQINSASGGPVSALNNVSCCYNSVNKKVIFSWVDQQHNPWYAIYDPSADVFTTAATLLYPTYNLGVFQNVYCCYSPINNQVLFTWGDYTTSDYPRYAVYDFNTNSFSQPPALLDGSISIGNDIFNCYMSQTNQAMLACSINGNSYATYAIYDFSTQTLVKGFTQLYTTPNTGGIVVSCAYNNKTNQIVFVWPQTLNQSYAYLSYPFFAIYDVSSHTFPLPPTQIQGQYELSSSITSKTSTTLPFSTTALQAIYASYDTTSNQILINFVQDLQPEYSEKNSPYDFLSTFILYNATTNMYIDGKTGVLNPSNPNATPNAQLLPTNKYLQFGYSTGLPTYNSALNKFAVFWSYLDLRAKYPNNLIVYSFYNPPTIHKKLSEFVLDSRLKPQYGLSQ